jgi:hypothetical protein
MVDHSTSEAPRSLLVRKTDRMRLLKVCTVPRTFLALRVYRTLRSRIKSHWHTCIRSRIVMLIESSFIEWNRRALQLPDDDPEVDNPNRYTRGDFK